MLVCDKSITVIDPFFFLTNCNNDLDSCGAGWFKSRVLCVETTLCKTRLTPLYQKCKTLGKYPNKPFVLFFPKVTVSLFYSGNHIGFVLVMLCSFMKPLLI